MSMSKRCILTLDSTKYHPRCRHAVVMLEHVLDAASSMMDGYCDHCDGHHVPCRHSHDDRSVYYHDHHILRVRFLHDHCWMPFAKDPLVHPFYGSWEL